MPKNETYQILGISRRRLLRGAAVIAGGGGLLVVSTKAAAKAKISQKSAGYRSMANGKQQCDNCLQWQDPGSCKVVAGSIDRGAWCSLYAPKPKADA